MNFSNFSDIELDQLIVGKTKALNALIELKNLRVKRIHFAVDFRGSDDRVTSVICYCGEETKYKVPLNSTEDFACPKDPNREGRKET